MMKTTLIAAAAALLGTTVDAQEALPAATTAGGTLVIVSGELVDRAQALEALTDDQAIVHSDVNYRAALACGLASRVDDEVRRRYWPSRPRDSRRHEQLVPAFAGDILLGPDAMIRYASPHPISGCVRIRGMS